jgi:predicted  nucleic acid-binding Zn-ribbon protein
MDDYVKRSEFDNLKNQVERLEKEMDESSKLLQAIDKKIDVIGEKIITSEKIDSLTIAPLSKRVDALEDSQKWLRRSIAGAVIGIIIEAVLFYIKAM